MRHQRNWRNSFLVSFALNMSLLVVSLLVIYRWPQYKPYWYATGATVIVVLLIWIVVERLRKARNG
jgi:uncharacterized membrane protein YqjE